MKIIINKSEVEAAKDFTAKTLRTMCEEFPEIKDELKDKKISIKNIERRWGTVNIDKAENVTIEIKNACTIDMIMFIDTIIDKFMPFIVLVKHLIPKIKKNFKMIDEEVEALNKKYGAEYEYAIMKIDGGEAIPCKFAVVKRIKNEDEWVYGGYIRTSYSSSTIFFDDFEDRTRYSFMVVRQYLSKFNETEHENLTIYHNLDDAINAIDNVFNEEESE